MVDANKVLECLRKAEPEIMGALSADEQKRVTDGAGEIAAAFQRHMDFVSQPKRGL